MSVTIQNPNKIEKVLEENSFIILLETRIIIKNEKERIEFYLNDISNLRILKKRNLTPNITLLFITIIFYLSLFTQSESFFMIILSLFSTAVLTIFAFLFKSYTYKLLVNSGAFNFNEIVLSKKNILHAESFLNKFSQKSILITNE